MKKCLYCGNELKIYELTDVQLCNRCMCVAMNVIISRANTLDEWMEHLKQQKPIKEGT